MPPTYTESQNCSCWKGPLEIILSRPLPRQGRLEQETPEHVQVSFECPWRGTHLDPLDSLWQCSAALNIEKALPLC